MNNMGRNYKPKPACRRNQVYTKEALMTAIRNVITKKMTLRRAHEVFNIPLGTRSNHVNSKVKRKYGGQSALSEDDEKYLVVALKASADFGFPLNARDLQNVVKGFLDRQGRSVRLFNDNRPGKEWVYKFLQRHRDVTVRLSENIKRVRAGVNHEIINSYFDQLEVSLAGDAPEAILDYDETNFTDKPGKIKVFSRRGARHVENIEDHSKTSTSVMLCISGSGEFLPIYVLYKAKFVHDTWIEGGTSGMRFGSNVSFFLNQDSFDDWFTHIALPYFRRIQGPKVLIGDNLSSHLSAFAISACQDNEIRFVLLPPNATHLTQPLDVAFMRPLKGTWRQVLNAWKQKNRGVLPKCEFPKLLKQTVEAVGQEKLKQNALSGFKKCGLIPLDRTQVLKMIPAPDQTNAADDWKSSFMKRLHDPRASATAPGPSR